MVFPEAQNQPISKFKKMILLTIVAFILAFFIGFSIILTINYGPNSKPYSVILQHFNTTNFYMTTSPLLVTWDSAITIKCNRRNQKITFRGGIGILSYEGHDYACTTSNVKTMPKYKEDRDMEFIFDNKDNCIDGKQPVLEPELVKQMSEDRKKGSVKFSMRIDSSGAIEVLKPSWVWQRRLVPFSPEFNVEFVNGTGFGKVDRDLTKNPITFKT